MSMLANCVWNIPLEQNRCVQDLMAVSIDSYDCFDINFYFTIMNYHIAGKLGEMALC